VRIHLTAQWLAPETVASLLAWAFCKWRRGNANNEDDAQQSINDKLLPENSLLSDEYDLRILFNIFCSDEFRFFQISSFHFVLPLRVIAKLAASTRCCWSDHSFIKASEGRKKALASVNGLSMVTVTMRAASSASLIAADVSPFMSRSFTVSHQSLLTSARLFNLVLKFYGLPCANEFLHHTIYSCCNTNAVSSLVCWTDCCCSWGTYPITPLRMVFSALL